MPFYILYHCNIKDHTEHSILCSLKIGICIVVDGTSIYLWFYPDIQYDIK